MQPTQHQPIPGHVQQADKDLDQQIDVAMREAAATARANHKQLTRLGLLLMKKQNNLAPVYGAFGIYLKTKKIARPTAYRLIAQAKRGLAKPIEQMGLEEIEAEQAAAALAAQEVVSRETTDATSPDDVPDFGDTPKQPAQPATPRTPVADPPKAPEREPGDDHDAEGEPEAPETEAEAFKRIKGEYEAMKAHRAACREKIEPKPTNGAHFEWGAFLNAWGTMLRQIDVVGNLYGCKETPDAEGLRRQNQQYKDNFRNWVRKVSKTEPPPEPHERSRNGHHREA